MGYVVVMVVLAECTLVYFCLLLSFFFLFLGWVGVATDVLTVAFVLVLTVARHVVIGGIS